MKKWITIISLMATIGIGIFIFNEAKSTHTGYIIGVFENDIWLVGDSLESIQGKTEEELSEIYKFRGTFYDTKRIPFFIKKNLKVGQKVRVFSDGRAYETAPSEDEATFLFILK
jgi:hypothetical protein